MAEIDDGQSSNLNNMSRAMLNTTQEAPELGGASLSELPDAFLAEKAQKGDLKAFEELFKRYYMPIYRLGIHLCRNAQDAEEVAQVAFAKAARGIGGFRGESAFKSWLWRIAINCSHDLRRRRKNQEEPVEDIAKTADEATSLDSLRQDAEETRRSDAVFEALESLPDKQREAIIMTVYDEMSHDDVAKVLGVSINTVSWRVHAAKKKLKVLIEKRLKRGEV